MSWGFSRKRKYGGEKVKQHGYSFDSKLEAALHQELLLVEKAGEIANLQHHPGTVFLTRARIQYRPDFRFTRVSTGDVEYAESKGFETPMWRIKRKLWEYYGPGKLYIYRGSHTRLVFDEVIIPKGGSNEARGESDL